MSTRLRLDLTLRSSFALLLLTQGASAQIGPPCFTSAECGAGFVCSNEATGSMDAGSAIESIDKCASNGAGIEGCTARDGGTNSLGGSEDARAPLPELPAVELGGNCVPKLDPCKEDTDCESGYHCELHGTGLNTRSCEESGTCNASEAGEGAWLCAPNEFTCDTDSDCPEPTVCAEGECVYEVTSCEANSDCDAGYVCAASRDEESREPASETAAVAPDASGYSADVVRICFPPPVACESNADCNGWECHTVPQEGNPPIGWETLDKACMPPGLVAVIERRIETVGSLDTSVPSTDGSPSAAAPAESDAGSRADEDKDDSKGAVVGDSTATDDISESADDGCNLAAGRSRAAFGLPAWLALALIGWRRSTRRAAR